MRAMPLDFRRRMPFHPLQIIYMKPCIVVIIPAYNEEKSIGKVVSDLPRDWVEEVVVVDNNSSDQTADQAQAAGATVVPQPLQGYGNACLAGMNYVICERPSDPDIIVFIDGDYSDYPGELPLVVAPILEEDSDLVIGSRA